MVDAVSFHGYSVYTGPLPDVPDSGKIEFSCINQNAFCVAEEDADFKESLQECEILLPDGIGIVFAVRFLLHKKIRKITGTDTHLHLLQDLNLKNGSCFYLGSSEDTLLKIKEKLSREYPNIKVETYSPPYKPEFSDADSKQMIDAVNAFKPDVLFIGMTAPKQEKWAHKYREELDTKMIGSIGAAFDFYAGTIKRPNSFWIKLGLEWFIRLVKEPKRMRKRYLYYGPVFLKWVIIEKFR